MQFGFGAGSLVGVAQSDYSGTALAVPIAVELGTLQDVSIDFSFDIKELFGQYQFPVAVGRGKGKITGKAKAAQLNMLTVNSLVFGQTLATGILAEYKDLIGTAIPVTPYQITPTMPGSGTWTQDDGVLDDQGKPMLRVVSGPTTGQYSVTSGVYTFAAADSTRLVRISSLYTATSTSAKKLTVANVLMGQAPVFRADFMHIYNGKQFVLSLPQCISNKFSYATKIDDFAIPEFDFSSFADASGNVAYLSSTE